MHKKKVKKYLQNIKFKFTINNQNLISLIKKLNQLINYIDDETRGRKN